ncbi:probable nucleoporin Nup54 [Galendromus occidentalis]|uniref:Probable nucleoporin Nup54 n=1 Tax=Galendromus occidentalis TaxID=34638 RepID=A0AAJ6QS15_9ACAR|nr:probable nucleoporin Nup54 [Galendromus occidentalis]
MFGSTANNNAPGTSAFGAQGSTGFGNTTFGAAPSAGTSGFGTPGFGTNAGTASAGFGTPGFGSSATPGGNTTFGTPTGGASATFGTPAATGFGAATSTSFGTPSAGGFGTQGSTGFGTSGFGTTGTSAFGTPGNTAFKPGGTTGFGATGTTGFGATGTTGFGATGASGFGATGTTGFGTTGSTGFGTTGTTGFGATAFNLTSTTANTGFGAPATGTSSTFGNTGSSFGAGFGTTGSGFGTTGTTGFGSGFGSQFSFTNKPATSFSFGGASAPTAAIGGAQQQSQQALQDVTLIATAVTVPMIYNDERDKIIATFNQLQAKWGRGKGFHSQSGPPVNFTPDNPFCKFRTIGYNALPTYRPEEGLVCLLINKRVEEVTGASPSFTEALHRDVIKSQNISVFLDSINDMGNNQTQVVVYVYEKSPTGTGKKFTSGELMNAFEQASCKAALANLGVVNMTEMTEISKNAVEQYLANPPPGIDALLWEQAKADNPDPSKLIPVPLIGFEDLSRRMKFQCDYQERQKARLEKMAEEAAELEKKCESSRCRVEELREKQYNIAHRILKVIAAFEVNRKMGFGIQSEEETLKASLEEILREIEILSTGKLNELQVAVKSAPKSETNGSTQAEEPLSEDMLKLVQEIQKGLLTLIMLLQDDSRKLDEIEKALAHPEV